MRDAFGSESALVRAYPNIYLGSIRSLAANAKVLQQPTSTAFFFADSYYPPFIITVNLISRHITYVLETISVNNLQINQ